MMKKRLLSIMLICALACTMQAGALVSVSAKTTSKASVVLKAKASGSTAVKLSWTKAKGANKYVVYGAKKGKTLKKIKTIKSSKVKSLTVKKLGKSKLSAGKNYSFRVVAYHGKTKLCKSKKVSVKTAKAKNPVDPGDDPIELPDLGDDVVTNPVTPPTPIEPTNPPTPASPTLYSVTVHNGAHGTAAASVTSAEAGTVVTLTATPIAGYNLAGWLVVSGGITVTGNQFTMPEGNVEITALWKPETMTPIL